MTEEQQLEATIRTVLRDALRPARYALENQYVSAGLGRSVWRWMVKDATRRIVDAVTATQIAQDSVSGGGRDGTAGTAPGGPSADLRPSGGGL